VRNHTVIGLLLATGVAAIVGCSGGGQSNLPRTSAPPNTGGSSAAPAAKSKATFTLTLPLHTDTSASGRTPKYISPNAQSIAISVAVGTASPGPATVANLTASSPNCTAAPGAGTLTCSIVVPAPIGSDTFGVSLYSATNAGGSVLSSATITGTVADNAANTIPITLNGVVASITVIVADGLDVIPGGYATSVPVVVTAQDASGATIVGPGDYANPISLANADTSGITSLSTTTVSGPSTAVTLTYAPTNANGGVLDVAGLPVGATQISASASGVQAANSTPGTFAYIADRFWGFGHTRTLSGTGSVTVTAYTGAGSPMPSPSTYAYAINNATTVNADVPFNGNPTTDTHHVTTFTQTAPAPSASPEVYTLDQYHVNVPQPAGNWDVYFYGQAVNDVNAGPTTSPITGDGAGTIDIAFTYPVPGAWIDDVLPHATTTWSNTGVPFTQAYSGAETATFQYTSGGATSFTETAPGNIAWTGDAVGNGTNVNGGVTTTIGLPVAAPSPAGGDVIPVAEQTTSPSPGPVTNYNAADWYPGGGAPAQPLWQWNVGESYVALPAQCNVPSTIATQAWQDSHQQSQVRVGDFSLRSWTQNDYYVDGGVGWVCETYSETDTSFRFKTGVISSQTQIAYAYGVTSTSDLARIRRPARR
jgi:hypothetical protein